MAIVSYGVREITSNSCKWYVTVDDPTQQWRFYIRDANYNKIVNDEDNTGNGGDTVTGLSPKTTYYYNAANRTGPGPNDWTWLGSAISFTTAAADSSLFCEIIQDEITATSIALSGITTPTGISELRVFCHKVNETDHDGTSIPTSSTSYTIRNLSPGTTYEIRLRAQKGNDFIYYPSSDADPLRATTKNSSTSTYIYYGGRWRLAQPYIYYSGRWYMAQAYIYSGGSWHPA